MTYPFDCITDFMFFETRLEKSDVYRQGKNNTHHLVKGVHRDSGAPPLYLS